MGGGGDRSRVGVGSKNKNMSNYKHEPSQNSCTQHIAFVTIYISKEKDHK